MPAIQVCQKAGVSVPARSGTRSHLREATPTGVATYEVISAAPARTVPPTPVGCSERSRALPTDPFGLLNKARMWRTVTSSRARPDSATCVSD